MALLVLWQALALTFHLATERHLVPGDFAPGDLIALVRNAAAVASLGASEDDADAEHPHAPHAAIDHQVAQDRADDDLHLMPSWWLPMVAAVTVPRDCVGVSAGAPPTGPPPARRQRASIAARAPPLA